MRVAVLATLPFSTSGIITAVGGGERYPTALAGAMSAMATVTLVSVGSQYVDHRDAVGLRRVVLPWITKPKDPLDPLPAKNLVDFFRDFDIIHVHYANRLAVLAAAAARVARRPCIFTPLGGGSRIGLGRLRTAQLFSGFASVTSYAEGVYPWMKHSTRKRAVLYGGGDNFVSVSAARPRANDVLCIGRILPHKGFDRVIQALPDAASLVICGRVHSEEYFAFLKNCAAGKNVRFVTDADDSTVAELLRNTKVVVAASTRKDYQGTVRSTPELLGLVLLEAMYAGCAVVATDVGPAREIIRTGDEGLVIRDLDQGALSSALSSLLHDDAIRLKLASAGQERARAEFTWSATAERALRFYARF